ncbi:C-type mannose receptor 2-like [Boleophthalmus pectinirostris]|uniref:C-type mannose receptor 2-like n=1 Tax=Boleophthalmus pectinirostris TaxID=150288 RepID=UPI00242C8B6D|nr:C-type mannose receptor 2-like [Boleophthalmus pectinirostris]
MLLHEFREIKTAQNSDDSRRREAVNRLSVTALTEDNYTSELWVYFQGSAYLGSTTAQSWEQSRQYCQERGGDLIIITSVQEQTFASRFRGHRWIGLNATQSEPREWRWVDGSQLNTSFWHTGEPNNKDNDEFCVETFVNGTEKRWNDLKLMETRVLQVIEEREQVRQKLQDLNNHSHEGWVYFQGSLYLGSSTEQSWQESRLYCQQRGADLTVITSVQEQEFAYSTFKERRWIGLTDLEQEGVWKWVDGSRLTLRFWDPDQPDNKYDEDCGRFNMDLE